MMMDEWMDDDGWMNGWMMMEGWMMDEWSYQCVISRSAPPCKHREVRPDPSVLPLVLLL